MTAKVSISDESPVLVVGTGYLGTTVAALARRGGCRVITTTRSPGRARELTEAGYDGRVFDWNRPLNDANRSLLADLPALAQDGRVLISVSYDPRSGQSRYETQVHGLRRLLDILPAHARICYISTTGVYQHTDGSWVDEITPTRPSRPGGQVHLQAEQLFHRHRPFGPWSILRLAGIYGPGRVPRVADVLAGTPIAADPDSFLNLIHVHDAARAVLAAWRRMDQVDQRKLVAAKPFAAGPSSRLFVISDDQPVTRGEFYREVARQCRVAEPRFASADAVANGASQHGASQRGVSQRVSNKRVSNRRMKRELLPSLIYRNYRLGLADVLSASLE